MTEFAREFLLGLADIGATVFALAVFFCGAALMWREPRAGRWTDLFDRMVERAQRERAQDHPAAGISSLPDLSPFPRRPARP